MCGGKKIPKMLNLKDNYISLLAKNIHFIIGLNGGHFAIFPKLCHAFVLVKLVNFYIHFVVKHISVS